MIDGPAFLDIASLISLVILCLAFLLTVLRVILGPGLPDRVLALDMLIAIAIGFIGVIGIRTGFTIYLDIAIALGLVGFLTTVAFSRFILSQKYRDEFHDELTPLNAKDSSNG